MRWRVRIVASLLFFPSLDAQVPYGYLIVAEETASGRSCAYADPQTGLRTELLADSGPITARGLAVDPVMPGRLHLLGDGPAVGTAVLQGSRSLVSDFVPFAGGTPMRLRSAGAALLAVVAEGASPGLWSVSLEESSTLIHGRPGARDVCAVAGKAYLISHASLSRIDEVDLTTGQVRTLGTAYPEIRSIGKFVGNALMAGTPSGELLSINRFSGAVSSLGNPRLGAITAIADDPVSGLPYFSTGGRVYRFGSFSSPVYTAEGAILDLDVGVHDLPSWLFYGEGCSTGSSLPRFVYVDAPARGATFTAALAGGPPQSGAFLVAGFSRRWWSSGGRSVPFPLGDLVPGVDGGCSVLTDVRASWFLNTDALGQGQVLVGVPDLAGLVGVHASWQWVLMDAGAPGGLVCSHGAEAIVR